MNVDPSLVGFTGIHLRAIAHQVNKPLSSINELENYTLKFLPHLPGANELTHWPLWALNKILEK